MKIKDKKQFVESYTAAGIFPKKLIKRKVIRKDKTIVPIHAQLILTNHCNLNCSFCSCSDRQKSLELDFDEIKKVLDILSERGSKSITITGGGEPLLHPKINEVIDYARKKHLKIGLVTNGILLKRLKIHDNITWCRISSDDSRIPSYDLIESAIKINPKIGWAFSHVVTRKPNYIIIKNLIKFANKHNFTHVRLVSDLFDLDNVPDMQEVKRNLGKIEDNIVIYQGRKESTKGTKDCYISLLKPVIGPEGIFPCCGVQYSINGQPRDMIKKMRMGKLKDLPKILDNQKHFDGSICDVCYYKGYNDFLAILKQKIDHKDFV